MLTIPEHLASPLVLSVIHCVSVFVIVCGVFLPFLFNIVLSVLLLPYPFGILLYCLSFFCLTPLVSYGIVCPSSALSLWYLIVLSVLLLPYPFGILLYCLSFFCLTHLVSYCIVCPSSALPLWYLIVLYVLLLPLLVTITSVLCLSSFLY